MENKMKAEVGNITEKPHCCQKLAGANTLCSHRHRDRNNL